MGRFTGFERYLGVPDGSSASGGSNRTAAAISADGLAARTSSLAAGIVARRSDGVGGLPIARDSRATPRGRLVQFVGVGAANDTFTCKVRHVLEDTQAAHGNARDRKAGVTTIELASLTLTLGTQAGVAGGVVGTDFLYADTLVLAAAAAGSWRAVLEAGFALGEMQAYSPANDTAAVLVVPEVHVGSLVLDLYDTAGAVVSMDALIGEVGG